MADEERHGDFAAGERTQPPEPGERDFAEGVEETRPGRRRDFAEGIEQEQPEREGDFAEGERTSEKDE
jgi:hypothetical protein